MATQTKVAANNWGIFFDGKWLNEGETSEIRSPYDHSMVGLVHLGTTSHAEAAVRAAQRAFEITKKSPGYERKRILNAISEGIRARSEEFSQVMCLEAGKPIKTARVEVDRAIFTFAVAAEEATRIGGEWLPLDWQSSTAGRAGIVRRFPVGPILAITPFNFPLNLVAHKVAPAIAAGCKIETGGKRKGSMVEPTVLTHTRPDMKVRCEEVFAPVVLVEPYENFADAIRQVNDSPNGLQAGVFTRDVKLLFTAFDELEVGGVISGDTSSFRIDHMPYGGVKDSGLGREGLRYAIEEMTEPRLLVLNLQ